MLHENLLNPRQFGNESELPELAVMTICGYCCGLKAGALDARLRSAGSGSLPDERAL